ncbi:hypothetical protein [Clostridium scatologenes]|uniref:Uncharacterized protein n=1 Tax=Clostridium scatologenes TaxID=1548 RepID=A0A0E3M9Z7_CLOSL|nr:hypothetical protein [Clostridium scatologenes]AKA70132.1 hypothetical protein CSCA_3007 [Clostridium scatologenes]
MEITNLKELQEMAKGDVVQLPPFKNDIPFCARVRQASMLNLVQKGIIPNSLLSAAEEVFYGKQSSKGKVDMIQMAKLMFTMAENTLIEPSIKDINEAGLELTDMQLIDLFNYTQKGVEGLKSFRPEQQDIVNDSNSEAVQ